ncbi:hypothetical protein PR048_032521 [Dryococelus australis]|uniref:Uncharacterized protein n=1 Tax=Dryococelus australis TaxID=614101 RepID=A0ABQ9G2G0_9NEOP|nr:hypothetical protein PR048_032521 [Dryococelus australis]
MSNSVNNLVLDRDMKYEKGCCEISFPFTEKIMFAALSFDKPARLHSLLYSRASDVCSLAAAPVTPHTWQYGIRFLFPCKSASGSDSSRAVSAESLIDARYRRQDCTPVQRFARRGDENVDAHASVAPSTPTLLGLSRAKFLQPRGSLKAGCRSPTSEAATTAFTIGAVLPTDDVTLLCRRQPAEVLGSLQAGAILTREQARHAGCIQACWCIGASPTDTYHTYKQGNAITLLRIHSTPSSDAAPWGGRVRQTAAGHLRRGWGEGGAPVTRIGTDSRRGCPQIFTWSAGFLEDLPFPPPFHSGDAPYSPLFTLVGSQDLDVKSRPNLSAPLLLKFYFQDIPPPCANKAKLSIENYTKGTTHRIPWNNRTMASSNTDTNRTGVLAVVDTGKHDHEVRWKYRTPEHLLHTLSLKSYPGEFHIKYGPTTTVLQRHLSDGYPFCRPPFVSPPPPEQTRDRDSHESARATRRRLSRTQLTSLSAGPPWHPMVEWPRLRTRSLPAPSLSVLFYFILFPPQPSAVRLHASYLGEPGSIPSRVTPGISQVGILPDGSAGRRVFSGISRFPRPCIPTLIHSHIISPTSALKTSLLRAAQISQLSKLDNEPNQARIQFTNDNLKEGRKTSRNLHEKNRAVRQSSGNPSMATANNLCMRDDAASCAHSRLQRYYRLFTGKHVVVRYGLYGSCITLLRYLLAGSVARASRHKAQQVDSTNFKQGKGQAKNVGLAFQNLTYARLHRRGSKLDPRSNLRWTQKTVAPFEFRAGLEIEMKAVRYLDTRLAAIFYSIYSKNLPNSMTSNKYEPIVKFVSYLISISHFGTKIDDSEIQNHEILLVQHFYIGTKFKLDPGSELGSFDLGSGKMLVQPDVFHPNIAKIKKYPETAIREIERLRRVSELKLNLVQTDPTPLTFLNHPPTSPPASGSEGQSSYVIAAARNKECLEGQASDNLRRAHRVPKKRDARKVNPDFRRLGDRRRTSETNGERSFQRGGKSATASIGAVKGATGRLDYWPLAALHRYKLTTTFTHYSYLKFGIHSEYRTADRQAMSGDVIAAQCQLAVDSAPLDAAKRREAYGSFTSGPPRKHARIYCTR